MRMHIIAMIFLVFCCQAGCAPKEKAALSIGSVNISAREFEAAYQNGKMQSGRELSRKEFLDLYINRTLFLKEAEVLGLDKDPLFLQGLQFFWEQSLMKSVIARKINESTMIIRVSDREIFDYYERHKDSDFAGKQIDEVKTQIKLFLFQLKQRLELQNWMENLRRRTPIYADPGRLGLFPDNKEEQ
ncbi:MAG: hypothetical protein WCY10_02850 [Candidatus Omnitrophota bacterium]